MAPGDVIVLAQHGGQTQFLQVMLQQQLRGVGGMGRSVQSIVAHAERCCRGSEYRLQHARKALIEFFCA